MMFFRRQLLRSLPLSLLSLVMKGRKTQASPPPLAVPGRSPLLAMGEIRLGELDRPEIIQRRFDLYKTLGCGTLRTALGWRDFEKSEGLWQSSDSRLKTYYELAARNSFRLKCQFGAVSAVPAWFLDKYTDARLINQRGDWPRGYMSPWYPGGPAILAERIERVFQASVELGAFDLTDFIIVDLGPAGEPTYPAAWHMGHGYTPANTVFWYFDPHAQRDFGVKMEQKYSGNLAAANRAWQTSYRNWGEVTPPVPGSIRGQIWIDLLQWYYDTKRRMISEQVSTVKKLIQRHSPTRAIRPLLLLPGDHSTQADFDYTARNGDGTYLVKIAADTENLADEAARSDCWLQYG